MIEGDFCTISVRKDDRCMCVCVSFRSNVTPNAQESEDSGLSLSYSVLTQDVANRISTSAALERGHDHLERDFNDSEHNEYVGDERNEFG